MISYLSKKSRSAATARQRNNCRKDLQARFSQPHHRCSRNPSAVVPNLILSPFLIPEPDPGPPVPPRRPPSVARGPSFRRPSWSLRPQARVADPSVAEGGAATEWRIGEGRDRQRQCRVYGAYHSVKQLLLLAKVTPGYDFVFNWNGWACRSLYLLCVQSLAWLAQMNRTRFHEINSAGKMCKADNYPTKTK